MNKHLKHYLDSFKVKKEHGISLLTDAVSFGLIGLIIFVVGTIFNKMAYNLSNGQTTEELKVMLLSNPEQAEAFLAQIKTFALAFTFGMIAVAVASLFIYSFSRKLIWNYLAKHKTKYWKWNLLNLALVLPLILYLFMLVLLRMLLALIVALFKSQLALDVYFILANLIIFITIMVFFFLVYQAFNKKYKVWESLGDAFQMIRSKWSNLWRMFLLILGTAILLTVILLPLGNWLMYRPGVLTVINLIIAVLFLTWMRVYVYERIKD